METVFLVGLFILGACFGSFLCCQARRLRIKDKHGKKSVKKLGSRSVCLHCKAKLKWYDNIPIISWLILAGKCRSCHRKIGWLEFLSEIGLAASFVAIGTTININSADCITWIVFIITLLFTLVLAFLAIYDGAYGELPLLHLILATVLAFIISIIKQSVILLQVGFTPSIYINPLGSVAILGGLYLLLYLISKGKWVGDGDWLLGAAIGLALSNPWLALTALFISNLLACIVMLPFVIRRKNKQIYFGPFMAIAFVITVSFSGLLISLI
ncbi:prepilin peptidase [Candidatus Saccharibacteria bacterium]|nr:prepilin peptidase [Candidatus Saccharibacteria bacterium]